MKNAKSKENPDKAKRLPFQFKIIIAVVIMIFILLSLTIFFASSYLSDAKIETLTKDYEKITPIEIDIFKENSLTFTLVDSNWSLAAMEEYDSFNNSAFFIQESDSSNQIFSIKFTKFYDYDIIKNISMQSSTKDVIDALGQPHFEDKQNNTIGYVFSDFYIFFSGTYSFDEIIIYRKDNIDSFKSIKNIIEPLLYLSDGESIVYGKLVVLEGSNKYEYISSGLIVEKANDESKQTVITVYKNYAGDLKKDLLWLNGEPELQVNFELDKDLVFEKELQRLSKIDKKPIKVSPSGKLALSSFSESYGTGIRLYYLDKSKKDICLFINELNSDIFWLGDRYFAYTNKQESVDTEYLDLDDYITIYDTNTNEDLTYYIPKEVDVTLIDVSDGKLIYKTGKSDKKEHTMLYEYDENGDILLSFADKGKIDYELFLSSQQEYNVYEDEGFNNAKGLRCSYSRNKARLEGIEQFKGFECLTISGAKFNDCNVLKNLSKLGSLKKVEFYDCEFSNPDEAIKILGSLTNIESLGISALKEAKDVNSLTNIKELNISDCTILNFSSLNSLQNLKSLTLTYEDQKSTPLPYLKNLESLRIGIKNPNESIDFLMGMTKLKTLYISEHNFELKNNDSKILSTLKNLQYLTIYSGEIDLEPFKKLENLIELDITFVYADDYTALLELKKLKKVKINYDKYNENKPGLLELKKKGILEIIYID